MGALAKKDVVTNGLTEGISFSNRRNDICNLIHFFATCKDSELRLAIIRIQQKLETMKDADEVFYALEYLHGLRSKHGLNRYEVEWVLLGEIIENYLVILINRESKEAEQISKGFINLLENFHKIRRLDSSCVLEAIEKKIREISLVPLD